ncbi:cyclin B [Dermacentor variabilis]|uniref:cyclin B n=1 Tax=Dermacentor variabilis TaxID=34621 RepID=UPI003F5C3C06
MATFGRSSRWAGLENLTAAKKPAPASHKAATAGQKPVKQSSQRPPLRQPNRLPAPKSTASKPEDVAALSQSLQKAAINAEQKPDAEGQAFSASLLPPGVPDIDAGDLEEPQMCAQYAQEIFDYMAYLEKKWPVRTKFLQMQPAVTPEMRAILINWMMMVHQRFQLLQETLFLAVSLTDRFLQEQSVSRSKLQLLGVSAIFVAGKFEEMMPPSLGDMIYVTDGAYQSKEVLRMEQQILRTLNWSLGRPSPLHFLRRNSKAAQADIVEHNLAKLVLELCLLDYPMAWVLPSEQAAAALCLSLRLFDREGQHRWGALMSHYGRYTEEALQPTIKHMAGLLLDAPESTHKAPYEKYKHSRLERVSTLIVSHVAKLRVMAGRP